MNSFFTKNKNLILLIVCFNFFNFITFTFVNFYVNNTDCLVRRIGEYTKENLRKINTIYRNHKKNESNLKIEKNVLIVGCPKSATKYASKCWQSFGYDIKYEKIGKDGMSSWFAAVSDKFSFASKTFDRKRVKFRVVLHQIRNPLNVIGSILAMDLSNCIDERKLAFICKRTSASIFDLPLLRALKIWVEWNKKAEKMADFSYQIEDWNEDKNGIRDKIFDLVGVKKENRQKVNLSNKGHGCESHPGFKKVTVDDIKRKVKDRVLLQEFQQLCDKYNYNIKVL